MGKAESSLVLISDRQRESDAFGTGFLIHQDLHYDYILTCRHVLESIWQKKDDHDFERIDLQGDAALPESIVSGIPAIDLVILKRRKFAQHRPAMELFAGASSGMIVCILGWKEMDPTHQIAPLTGRLTRKTKRSSRLDEHECAAWEVQIEDGDLRKGYSGGPVIHPETGRVIAIMTHLENAKLGDAIAAEEIQKISQGLPISVTAAEQRADPRSYWLGRPELLKSLASYIESNIIIPTPEARLEWLPEIIRETVEQCGRVPDDVLEIIRRCAKDPNGIEFLVRAIDSQDLWKELPAVLKFTTRVPHNHISGLLRRFNAAVLSDRPLKIIFNDIFPPHRICDLNIRKLGRWGMLRELCNEPERGGSYPLVDFLTLVGRKCRDKKIAAGLKTWVDEARTDPKPAARRMRPVRKAGMPAYLMVELIRKSLESRNAVYSARIYHWMDASNPSPVVRQIDHGDEDAVVRCLDDLIDQTGGESMPKHVEVILPCDHLFDVKPQNWKLKAGRRREAELGTVIPTVSRLDRRFWDGGHTQKVSGHLRTTWKARWRDFDAIASGRPKWCDWVCHVSREDMSDKARLMTKLGAGDARPAVFADFDPNSVAPEMGLADAMMDCGTPVAFWGGAALPDVGDLMHDKSPKDLPEILVAARKNPQLDKTIRELTLLWDDPKRELPGRKAPAFDEADDLLQGA